MRLVTFGCEILRCHDAGANVGKNPHEYRFSMHVKDIPTNIHAGACVLLHIRVQGKRQVCTYMRSILVDATAC
jgi:hypothetical protein